MEFTNAQNKIWSTLFSRQLENINKFACSEYKEGLLKLDLDPLHVPTIQQLNTKLKDKTGWSITHTNIRYLTAHQWVVCMGKKVFPITTYLRKEEELDFTPEPDMFHDIFGHLPFLLNPNVLSLINLFAEKMAVVKEEDIDSIAKLWWFIIEFGLIRENNKVKAFGAGLMSSYGEIQHAISNEITKKDARIEDMVKENPAVYSFHDGYFVFDSVTDMKQMLTEYFKTF